MIDFNRLLMNIMFALLGLGYSWIVLRKNVCSAETSPFNLALIRRSKRCKMSISSLSSLSSQY